MSTEIKQITAYDQLQELVIRPLWYSSEEMGRLFPDSILFGSLILYIITQNVSFGVLSIFFLETSLLHKVVAFVCEKTYGPILSPLASKSKEEIRKCRPGFTGARKDWERGMDKYPSVSVFFWGSLISYMLGANYSFSQVLNQMGQDWRPRTGFAITGMLLLTVLFIIGRLYGCDDSVTEIGLALILGLIAGILLYVVNLNVFGLESMNFNGLPIIVNKTEQGSTIYVCAPPQQ